MKKMLLLTALSALLSGSLVAAEKPAGPVETATDDRPVELTEEDTSDSRFYIGAGIGGARIHRAASPEPGTKLRGIQPYVVLRLGYDFADSNFSVEGFGMLGRAKADKHSGTQGLYGLGGDVLYHFSRYSSFDPFLTLGGGFYGGHHGPTWQDSSASAFFAQAGIGAFWHLNDSLSLRGDLRYHVALDDNYMAFTSADIGLTYAFGGENAEDSTDTLTPLAGPVEEGAKEYTEASEHAEILSDVTPVDAQDNMKLELRVQYAKDTAVIQPSNYAALEELARIIREAIAANPKVYVSIDGHTDRQYGSDYAYNQRLSEDRAKSVKTHLAALGVPAEKMKTAGHSFDMPKDPVDLKNGTPSNRRTDVLIHGVDEATRAAIRKQK